MCETCVCVCVNMIYIACTTIHYNNIDCYCYGYICFMLKNHLTHCYTMFNVQKKVTGAG